MTQQNGKVRKAKVVTLPEGYNGHTMTFFADPVQVDGNMVLLRCAEPGKEYMTAWRDRATVQAAFVEQAQKRQVVVQPMPGVEVRADGDANFFHLIDGNDWVAVIQLNGKFTTPAQETMMEAFADVLKGGTGRAVDKDAPSVESYCQQVCGGGECGVGSVCHHGIDHTTELPVVASNGKPPESSLPSYAGYVKGLPLQEALWWFIENGHDELQGRSEIFFALRERVRAEGQQAEQSANEARRIAGLVREGGDAGALDDVVHDECSALASGVNNDGTEAQVKHLLASGWTEAMILKEADVDSTPNGPSPGL